MFMFIFNWKRMKNNFLAMEENFLQLQVIFYPFPKQIWAFKHGTNISVQDNFDFVQDNFDFVQDNFDFVRDKNDLPGQEDGGFVFYQIQLPHCEIPQLQPHN